MSRRAFSPIAWLLLAVTLVGAAGEALAEVSARRERDRVHTAIFSDQLQSIADDPDPIPSSLIRWEPLGPTTRRPVNPTGDVRPDGPPYVAFHPTTGWPHVVWAFNNGDDHDIAYAKWTGNDWSEPIFVTASLDDERDPEAVVALDGTVHVVWWVDDDAPRVLTTSLGPTSVDFANATLVSVVDEHSARPSAALAGGALWIAYERIVTNQTPAGGTAPPVAIAGQVVVTRQVDGGEHVRALTIDSSRSAELDVEIHAWTGRLWVDWKLNDTQFAYVDADANGWGSPRAVPWPDESWIGVEDVRRSIRRAVLTATPDVGTEPPAE